MTQPSLHRKLAEVMVEMERVPKRGTAPSAMGGFKFVEVGDAADAIRKALGSRHISMLPSTVEIVGEQEHATKSGGTMTTLAVRTTWTLTDGESGETATIQSYGAGADTGDKYSGKAQTNSMKYALLTGFLMSTGDDPEADDSSDRAAPIVRPQQAPPTVARSAPRPAATTVPPEPEGLMDGDEVDVPSDYVAPRQSDVWSTARVLGAAEKKGLDKNQVGHTAKSMWGKPFLKDLTDDQRAAVAEELGL